MLLEVGPGLGMRVLMVLVGVGVVLLLLLRRRRLAVRAVQLAARALGAVQVGAVVGDNVGLQTFLQKEKKREM